MIFLIHLIQISITVVCLGMLVNGLLNGVRMRRDLRLARGHALPAAPPLISVCIPARNEGRNIGPCLESLARQTYPNLEILVLDDCSEDDTLAIATALARQYPCIRVLSGRPLAPGWIGKPHACQQLGEAARGEWILFTDADTTFPPSALEDALCLAQARQADLLSGLPRMEVVTLWERLSVPMLALIGVGLVNFELVSRLPWSWMSGASGAFLFFRRAAYAGIGGHECVRRKIVEDVELGRAVKRAGFRVVMTDVTRMVHCRMYTTFPEVWEGFTKNFYAAFRGPLFPLLILFLLGIFVAPWLSFIFGSALGWGPWSGTLLPLTQILSIGALKVCVDLWSGSSRFVDVLLTPLSALLMSAIALRSASRQMLRQPTPWRSRHYELWKS